MNRVLMVSKSMHPADINAALIKSGSNQNRLARLLGVDPSLVSHVVRGHFKSRPVATAISAATGIPVAELWPGQYEIKPGRPVKAA